MMATMKQYFQYRAKAKCGIPKVTLEGTREDWVDIYQRIDKLKGYSPEAIAWYHMLNPVLRKFVAAFDDPNSAENLVFWQHVLHTVGGGSRVKHMSGWLNAFCAFKADGTWLGFPFKNLGDLKLLDPKLAELSAESFTERYIDTEWHRPELDVYTLDGTCYPVRVYMIPSGHAEVDVKLEDIDGTLDTTMVVGSVGIRVEGEASDTLRPVSGWWIFARKDHEAERERGLRASRRHEFWVACRV
jgi:hypothetical protein